MAATNCTSTQQPGVILGTADIGELHNVSSAAACCAACVSHQPAGTCASWTWAMLTHSCFLKSNIDKLKEQADRISGIVEQPPAWRCVTDADCELLGRCDGGTCACASGFGGPSCGKLLLAPASAPRAGMVWLDMTQHAHRNASAWGFTAVRDPTDGRLHAVANVGCGSTQTHVTGSFMAHLSSAAEADAAPGSWRLAGAVAPTTSFNPHLMHLPAGTGSAAGLFVLYFRVNSIEASQVVCSGSDEFANGLPPSAPAPYLPACGSAAPPDANSTGCVHAGDPERGVNMYVAWAQTMAGPWQTGNVSITGAGALHKSNPSAAALPDGRVLLSYRFNLDGEQVGFALGETFRGPFVSVSNLTHRHGNDEDSYLWQQPDGSLHVIYHNGPHGYHAFATGTKGALTAGGVDNSGSSTSGETANFTFVKSASVSGNAFELEVQWSNGSATTMKRRERPEILFDAATGVPQVLFTAVMEPDGRSYSLIENFATSD